ncbi:creatininase family protein, partial [Nocardia cyriacigeorgica]|uniref:creatininase family protein n=1 Tax=Nocardia cyriacigeorgica TaxID=135487 RepID=UPI003CC80DBB
MIRGGFKEATRGHPHGPHLPLGADTMISDYFAHRLAADLDATIAPTIGYGVATPPQRLG